VTAGAGPLRFDVIMTAPRLAAPAVAVLEQVGCRIHYMPPYPSADAVAALTRDVAAHAILSRQGPVNAAAMDASPNLRIVARHGVGVDDVDLAAAKARGIVVARAPGSNTTAVAEHTLALILALAKDLRPLGATIAAGGWRGAAGQVRDIEGLRLGLLGFGAIGRAVARLAIAFGMQVTACDPNAAPMQGVAFVEAPAGLWPLSEVLSLHCPYLPATRHVVNAASIAALPRGAFVINTARGGLIDEAALVAALDEGQLAGAALDVFETEPPAAGDPLRNHPRVLVTPHVAGVTPRSLDTMGTMAAECIAACLTGGVVPKERIVSP
jgi:D-3-phosphoglycerate dehydrogenase / 2-oxoglutarate reductase